MAAKRPTTMPITAAGGEPVQTAPAATRAGTPGVVNRVVPLAHLTPHGRNYRRHPEAQIERLVASLRRFGQVRSVVVQQRGPDDYVIVAGEGLYQAARATGELTHLRADVIPADWSETQIRAYLIADNELSRQAEDDETLLAELIEEQQLAGFDLRTLGFSTDEFAALKERLADGYAGGAWDDGEDGDGDGGLPTDEDEQDPADGAPEGADAAEDGTALERLRLDLYEPPHTVAKGEVWRLGDAHVLCCADVFKGWADWQRWLVWSVAEAVQDTPTPRQVCFMPFPGPFVALSKRAQVYRYVLVQPKPYIASHILSTWIALHGLASVERLHGHDHGRDGDQP